MTYTGKDIIALGFSPGPHIPLMIERANSLGRLRREDLADLEPVPTLPLAEGRRFSMLAIATNEDEQDNLDKVAETMREVMRTPVVQAGAVMPDACPAGPVGTIPVGGVVASQDIHPGMHSADICCSLAISVFDGVSPADALDRIHAVTHFGPGGRDEFAPSAMLAALIETNPITRDLGPIAVRDMGTQGDGNHFAFVGTLKSTGQTALVTHHGSRGFGARVYRRGMQIAERYRQKLSPETLKQNAWIPADTKDADQYWDALRIVRGWTHQNHFCLHEATDLKAVDRFWNEHNFVFRKPDGLFYHGKGATPAFREWAHDSTDLTLIPMNMAEPILVTRGLNNRDALGFAPHGAGRNFSRSEHARRGGASLAEETKNIDARFFSGAPDESELPSAYKPAVVVKEQIVRFGMAEIVDEILPYGSIMAGRIDWSKGKRK